MVLAAPFIPYASLIQMLKRIAEKYGVDPCSFTTGVIPAGRVAHTYSDIPRFIGGGWSGEGVGVKGGGKMYLQQGYAWFTLLDRECAECFHLYGEGGKFKLNREALFFCKGIGGGRRCDFNMLTEEVEVLEKEGKRYEDVVKLWNGPVNEGRIKKPMGWRNL
ncbi:MAG: hypothetical protein ACTSWP_11925 [Candidatus Freyarchaeota archaeon]|nr:hypothetical protein [Candidatus Freyrarchaeum guaymaensis]